MKVAINGFGRIGKLILRTLLSQKNDYLDIVAINDLSDSKNIKHLLQYDSVHGNLPYECTLDGDFLIANNQKIALLKEANPQKIPWKKFDVDLVLECTGTLENKEKASQHLQAGAKRVIVSAPCKDADATIVYGVNHHILNANHKIISNASCTTNCLAPIAKILHDNFCIETGFMTTIHSYTNDQRLVDGNHIDLRRSRGASLSMIPTTTGAVKSIDLVIPELSNKLSGSAIRVPTPNVSLIDFCFTTTKQMSQPLLCQTLIAEVDKHFKNIVTYTQLPLVSCDFNSNSYSAIIDLSEVYVTSNHFARILAWYDNECGFANRMINVASLCAKL